MVCSLTAGLGLDSTCLLSVGVCLTVYCSRSSDSLLVGIFTECIGRDCIERRRQNNEYVRKALAKFIVLVSSRTHTYLWKVKIEDSNGLHLSDIRTALFPISSISWQRKSHTERRWLSAGPRRKLLHRYGVPSARRVLEKYVLYGFVSRIVFTHIHDDIHFTLAFSTGRRQAVMYFIAGRRDAVKVQIINRVPHQRNRHLTTYGFHAP